jgi:peptidoglycan/xylan/chitin deacetylase (PgdA/CDA1 family)
MGKFVSLEEIVQALDGGRPLPERALVVTFDDGLREQYEHAWPILQRLGAPAIFFINTGPIEEKSISLVHKIHLLRSQTDSRDLIPMLSRLGLGLGIEIDFDAVSGHAISHYKYDSEIDASLKYILNFVLGGREVTALIGEAFGQCFGPDEAAISESLYMAVDEVRTLAEAGCVGSHAHEHVPLGLLSPSACAEQVNRAADRLEAWTGQRPQALSYPYGSREACSPGAGEAAAAAGVRFAFTMERAVNLDLKVPLFLARFANNDVPGGKAALANTKNFFDTVPTRQWHRTPTISSNYS